MYVDDFGRVEKGTISGDADSPELAGETLARQLKARAAER
jgi:hypothetical protein